MLRSCRGLYLNRVSKERSGDAPALGGLIGETGAAVSERLGPPAAERATGEDRWMVFEGRGWRVRIRLAPGGAEDPARVRAWTATFDRGFPSFEAACAALDLSPDPPSAADRAGEPALYRRALPDPERGDEHSLTADARSGRIRAVTAFDEPPDWRVGAVRP